MIRPLLFLLMLGLALPNGLAGAQPATAPDRSRADCASPPTLVVPPDMRGPRRIFAPSGRNFRTLQARFASAYRLACRSRGAGAPLPARRLLLKNAPEANTTSIYRDGDEGAESRPLVMEHPFIGQGGRVDIPSVEELRSAITCSVYNLGSPGAPTGDGSECLVD